MKKNHQELIDQYRKNEKALDRSRVKTIVLEILMIGIVIYTKSIQETASLRTNIIATTLVTAFMCLHFWDFYPRKSLYKKMADIVLKGVNLENHDSFLKPQFFKTYLKDFNTLGFIVKMAIFDIIFIYFFSLSYTQLLKAINPEAIDKLKVFTPISTWLITLSLGWAYYRAIYPLSCLKRKLEA